MKNANQLRFIPNRTNLLSGNQSGAILKAVRNIIEGYDTEHVVNRKGIAYLKLKRDYTRDAKTPFYFYAYTYNHKGVQTDITKEFHKHLGMMFMDEAINKTTPYNPNYM